MKLSNIFYEHTGRNSGKWKHYFDYYDRHLERFVGKQFTLLEIGTCYGGSLQIWKKYFGPNVKIIGIDIDPRTKFEESQIYTEVGSQSDPEFLATILNRYGTPDVIIDDGSHIQNDVMSSFINLYPRLNDGGVYVIEDTHTSLWSGYNGGIKNPNNFVEIASRFAMDVNREFAEEHYVTSIPDLKEICFYNSMIFIEKQKTLKAEPCYVGTNSY
jgi:cephalosporin hydroxylase